MKLVLALRRYWLWILISILSLAVIWFFTQSRRHLIKTLPALSDDLIGASLNSSVEKQRLQQLLSESLKARFLRLKQKRRSGALRTSDLNWNLIQDSPRKKTMSDDPFQKLVHLDLKGAPPRIEYLQELLPFLKHLGATGLLLEYEDTFPFKGELRPLAASHAYSESDISTLLALAKDSGLSVIPLVQTFGHFEFVLKQEQFLTLREVEGQPFALCPRNPKSLPFVEELVDQVLQLHPDIKHIHIGADEVWNIGRCGACQSWMHDWMTSSSSNSSLAPSGATTASDEARDALFLDHIVHLATYIRQKYPKVKLIMWDDMFRDASLNVLTASGIGKLVEPMVWKYTPVLDLPKDIWDRYSSIFDSVWVASAFKGATGPNQYVTDIAYHIENHVSWLSVVEKEAKKFKNGISGIAITGWQRYDHFSGLCELLPTSLPSLALCLSTILQGEFSPQLLNQVSKLLGFASDVPIRAFPRPILIPTDSLLQFPGEATYRLFNSLANLDAQYHPFVHGDMLNTWFNPYHVNRNFTNPWRVHQFSLIMEELLQNYLSVWQDLNPHLAKLFFQDTVDEIYGTLFEPKIQKLEKLVQGARKQVAIGGRPSVSREQIPADSNPIDVNL